MYRQGRQDESHKDAHCHGTQQIVPEAERQKIDQFCHHGSQAGAEECRVDIAVHACVMKSGVQPGAKQHGQYIDGIFTKKSKARIDEKNGHGETRERNLQSSDQEDAQPHHQSGIKEGRAEPRQFKVVSDQCVPGQNNG